MIQVDNKWQAAPGCFLVRKADSLIMGEVLYIGDGDSIENYEERPYTQGEYEEFVASHAADTLPGLVWQESSLGD